MTLRNQLLILMSGLFILLIAIIGWTMLWLSDALLEEFDNQALQVGQNVASLVVMAGSKSTRVESAPELIAKGIASDIHQIITHQSDDSEQAFSFTIKNQLEESASKERTRKTLSFEFQAEGEGEESRAFQISIDSDQKNRSLEVFGPGFTERIALPNQGVEALLKRFSWQLIWLLILVLVLGLVAMAFIVYRLTQPLQALAYGAEKVGKGSLGNTVRVKASGEVGQAINAFNAMSLSLQQLEESNRRLQAKAQLSELGEIARGLAHALRNPLNTLGLSLEQLAKENTLTEAKKDQLARTAQEQINRIDQWINTLMSLADQGMQQSAVDIMAIIQDIQLECAIRKVHFDIKAEPLDIHFWGVKAELNMMIHALVINAVDASPQEGRVVIEINATQSQLSVVIKDQGPGLPESVAKHLFSPHLTTKTYGAGMGIYLTHRLATHRYQGRLSYQDRRQGGTQVQLLLRART